MNSASLNQKSSEYKERYLSYKKIMEMNRQTMKVVIKSDLVNLHITPLYEGMINKKEFKINSPLAKLKLSAIDSLTLGKVNKNCYLKLKFLLPVFKMTAIQGLVEDHTGKTCINISIYNLDLEGKSYDHYFQPGTIIYVKEPLYKISITLILAIRVDNPRDILFETDPEVMSLDKMSAIDAASQVDERNRLEGVRLMEQRDYVNAYLLYTEAITQTKEKDNLSKFLLNKAIVCFKLNLIQQYGKNVDLVLKFQPNSVKAIYHKIKHLYMTGKQEEALQLMHDKNDLFNETWKGQLDRFIKIDKSFKENKNIDWYRAFKYQELGQFFSNELEIVKKQVGVGIFTRQKIEPGQVVIVERAVLFHKDLEKKDPKNIILFQNQSKISSNYDKLYRTSVEFRKKITQLFVMKRSMKELKTVKEDYKILNILGGNKFKAQQLSDCFSSAQQFAHIKSLKSSNLGLYSKCNMINHSCEYNCTFIFIGETIIIYSVRPIEKGEQILISYSEIMDYEKRAEDLKAWDIECQCACCQQQLYEELHNKPMKKGRSRRLKMMRLLRQYREEQMNYQFLVQFYDLCLVVYALGYKDLELAARLFRRLFPMLKSESQNLLSEYL